MNDMQTQRIGEIKAAMNIAIFKPCRVCGEDFPSTDGAVIYPDVNPPERAHVSCAEGK